MMDEGYVRAYGRLYNEHWWWRAREAFLLEVIADCWQDSGRPRILDVGCGGGLFFDLLLTVGEVEGVEPEEALVLDRHRGRVHVGKFDDAFVPGAAYDVVLMLDVLEHLDDPAQALRKAAGLLSVGGFIIVTVPAFMSAWTGHDEVNQHRTRYTRASFADVARRAGVDVEWSRYFFHWVYLAKLLQRLREGSLGRRGGSLPTLPPRWLNGLLYRLSRAEMRMASPLQLPFGSSFIARCRASEPHSAPLGR